MLAEYREEITELKQSSRHFSRIFTKHNRLDQDIIDAEQGRVPLTQMEIDIMKKKKLLLKDEMLRMILELKKEEV
jgi:uncharacterized protein YdcH (DUF465 family)